MELHGYGQTQYAGKETKTLNAQHLVAEHFLLQVLFAYASVVLWSCFPPVQHLEKNNYKYYLMGPIIPVMQYE